MTRILLSGPLSKKKVPTPFILDSQDISSAYSVIEKLSDREIQYFLNDFTFEIISDLNVSLLETDQFEPEDILIT